MAVVFFVFLALTAVGAVDLMTSDRIGGSKWAGVSLIGIGGLLAFAAMTAIRDGF